MFIAGKSSTRVLYGFFIVIFSVIFVGGGTFATDKISGQQVESRKVLNRYRVYTVKHISAEQGKKYLAGLNINDVSCLPKGDKLLITASPADLLTASSVLDVVDSEQAYVIQTICPLSQVGEIPSNKTIEAQLDNISIGTFQVPPIKTASSRSIIDIHSDSVITVAPADRAEQIIAAFKSLQNTDTAEASEVSEVATVAVEPNQISESRPQRIVTHELQKLAESVKSGQDQNDTAGVDSDELFDKLLGSLIEPEETIQEAEETIQESEETIQEAEEKQFAAEAPEQQQAPDVTVVIEQPIEFIEEATVKVKKLELDAILERLAVLEAKAERPAEPKPVVIEVEQPNEPSEPNITVRSYEPEPVADGNEVLDLVLPEKLPIVDLLGLVGEYLHLDYMYDPANVKGEVSLKLQGKLSGPVRLKDLYPLLESVLRFKKLVMTRKGNLVTIVPEADAAGIDPVLLDEEKGEIATGDVIVTRIFRLKYIDVADADNLLKGMDLGIDINTSMSEAKTLFVTEFAYRMKRIEELLLLVDKPGEAKVFRFRQLRYTMASALVPKLETLARELGTISITVGAPAAKQQPASKGRTAPRTTKSTPPPPGKTTEPTVHIEADERTNRVLMIGLKKQLDEVEQLIDSLDVAQKDLRTLRLYDIQYVGAEEVQKKLQELGIISAGTRTTSTSRITSASRTAARTTQGKSISPAAESSTTTTISEEGGLVDEPQVVVIESTNSLLVNATDEQHEQIVTIIGYVDSETLEDAMPYEIYPLENQKPTDLAGVLNQLIQETIKDKEGKVEKVVKKQEEIEIIADENTFSLIVYASRKNQEWIRKLIKTLDKRRPQVFLDATLVEISNVDAFNYDLQLVSKLPSLASGGAMEKLSGALLTPFPSSIVREATSILGDAGSAKAFYADRHIQALLELMEKKGYGRVLAKPRILVNDNEPGHIDTKKTIYIARQSQTSSLSGTTTANDYYNISYTFDQFESGIELDITPHISEGNLLRLEIKLSRSSQPPPEGGIGENEPPPDKTENNIETIVTVPDESTIILGGILQLEQSKDNWKVPVIGDIPIVGGLFRKIDNSSRQSKLYIFVKANISRPSETALPDLRRISESNRAAFEEYESEFQKYQDWPGIDPEPMDPLRVLESK
jgi:general secretion pathway protein D